MVSQQVQVEKPVEVMDGLWQLKVVLPNNSLKYLLAYLFKKDGKCAIVDTGWNARESADSLDEQLHALNVDLGDIKTAVITHVHPDHFGLAGKIKEASGAEIIVHDLEKPFISSRYRKYQGLLDDVGTWLVQNGVPKDDIPSLQNASMPVLQYVSPADPDRTVKGGETITLGDYTFEVIWTPGHTPGHICLYERDRKVLLTGDHILPKITSNVSLHPEATGNPLDDYIRSLERVEDLDARVVLPGHQWTIYDLKGRVREIKRHHEERLEAMRQAIGTEMKSAYDVAAGVPWQVGNGDFHALSFWTRRAALSETLAHLEYMRRQGRVERTVKKDIVYYSLPK
jgi:glyoxylase-like metal-dependent hydrolase (beta-lactamase superfamily II)